MMRDDEVEFEFEEKAESFCKKQVYRRKPKKAKDIIGQLMARKGYNQNESQEQIQELWDSIVEPRMKGMSKATGIRGGKLTVIVKNAVVNQELTFNKKALLEKINNSAIGKRVKDIRIQIGVF